MTTVVETSAGAVQGRPRRGVLLFAGIPYAEPPTGSRRFRPPQPHPGWPGVRDATGFGPAAPQRPGMMELLTGGGEGPRWDEDCLYLNVVTPSLDGATRPVLVWIHGGGFTGGAGNIPWYDGTSFAVEGDCVVVTINYRLGALGFLNLSEHLPGLEGSANLGVLDQLAALRWVQENVAAFGGDPSNVTIFGESAGGMSVATLLGLPAARGLFHRAVAQSGAAHHVQSPDGALEVTAHLLEDLGLARPTELLECPPDVLLASQARVAESLGRRRGGLSLPFSPSVDGVVVDEQPLDVIRAGGGPPVPVVVGTNRDEWNAWAIALSRDIDEDTVHRRLDRLAPGAAAEIHATYRAARPEAELIDVWNAIVTDFVFGIPGIRLADAVVEAGQPVHRYRFDWASAAFDGRLGACHALEIPFVWRTIDRGGVELMCGGPAPSRLSDEMHRRWIAYAQGGPGALEELGWPGYDTDRRATLVFDEPELMVLDDPAGEERRVWDGRR